MEHKHKFMVSANSQDQGACRVDRFSNLPDGVAHRILSDLTLLELTRVGSLSKRCREFYLSTPSLDIYGSGGNKQEQLSLLNCIDRFLVHRGDNKIQSFRISWGFCSGISDEIFRLITWIQIAVRCNVEELEFQCSSWHSPETIDLPSCIFRCGSLRSLAVDLDTSLTTPSLGCSTLQILTLRNVRIDERFCKWISSSCQCIKKLHLYDVKIKSMVIESPSLESLTFEVHPSSDLCHLNISGEKLVEIHIDWTFYDPRSRLLSIVAPNLKYFKWIGKLLTHHDLGKLTFLEKAEILLNHKADGYDLDSIIEVICSICGAKVLILSDDTIKWKLLQFAQLSYCVLVLFREGSMHAPFNNMSFLNIHIVSLSDDLVPAMNSLLRGVPNLNTLFINCYSSLLIDKPKACGFNRKYWKSQNPTFVYQLKEVTIELSRGSNAVELALYILEHAQNLKKMVIFHLRHQSYIIKRVDKCKMASTATVVFHQIQGNEEKIRSDMRRYLYRLKVSIKL